MKREQMHLARGTACLNSIKGLLPDGVTVVTIPITKQNFSLLVFDKENMDMYMDYDMVIDRLGGAI